MARTHLCVKWKKTDANLKKATAVLQEEAVKALARFSGMNEVSSFARVSAFAA